VRLGRDSGGGGAVDLPNIQLPPRDREEAPSIELPKPSFPLQPPLPGTATPIVPPKKPGGGGF
jgi:hypothetical protein